jgi:ATP/maltotriose-dependent transcriptional regulator MalT
VELLERESSMDALERCLRDAADGAGCLVLLAGEAGVGKTSLLRAFADRHLDDAVVLWGACDALFTPRALGPVLDIAEERGDEGSQRRALAIYEELGSAPAVAMVLRRMRQRGVRGIPRGARPATRTNPAGLTSREARVAVLLAQGMTNA